MDTFGLCHCSEWSVERNHKLNKFDKDARLVRLRRAKDMLNSENICGVTIRMCFLKFLRQMSNLRDTMNNKRDEMKHASFEHLTNKLESLQQMKDEFIKCIIHYQEDSIRKGKKYHSCTFFQKMLL